MSLPGRKTKLSQSEMIYETFHFSPRSVIDGNQEYIDLNSGSNQSSYEPIDLKSIPLSPIFLKNEDHEAMKRTFSIFDWKERTSSSPRKSFPTKTGLAPSFDRRTQTVHDFDIPSCDPAISTTSSKLTQKAKIVHGDDFIRNESVGPLGSDDMSITFEEETFDEDDFTSLSTWMKSTSETDIWMTR